eukprot:m.75017 g.75017  ORF g.75017 m.75017 type:complete len:813 (+) comp7793_c0_seq1:93-2531(+)
MKAPLGLEPVEVLVQADRLGSQALALASLHDDLAGPGSGIERVAGHDLPVIKGTLRERLAAGGLPQVRRKAERLADRQVRLDGVHGCARLLQVVEDVASAARQDAVDAAEDAIRALDLDEIDRLHQARFRRQLACIATPASRWHDLARVAVDRVVVHDDIVQVEAHPAQGLAGQDAFAGSPLEARNNGVLDGRQLLHALGDIHDDVGPHAVRAERPDLAGIHHVPGVLVDKCTRALTGVLRASDRAILDRLRQAVGEGRGRHEEPVVLVGRLGEAHAVRRGSDGLAVRDDWLGHAQRDSGVVLLEVLEADLEVQLTRTRNDVLAGLLGEALDEGVGLRQPLEALNELGQIGSVLDVDGDPDDGGDGELHDLHVVRRLGCRNGAVLDEELVDPDEAAHIAARHILDRLGVPPHHQDGALDVLDEEIILLADLVVGPHNADLLAGCDGAREDAAERIEAAVGARHHLADVHHQRPVGVARPDRSGRLVVWWALVEELGPVPLGCGGRRQVDADHREQRVAARQPLVQDSLEQGLAGQAALLGRQLDVDLLDQAVALLLLERHDCVSELADRLEDELAEPAHISFRGTLAPLLLGRRVVVLSPEKLHEPREVHLELLRVHGCERADGEAPSLQAGAEPDGAIRRIHLDRAHRAFVVGVRRDDCVDALDDARERLVHVIGAQLQLEHGAVHLVEEEHRLDALGERLPKNSLGLHTDAADAIDHDESAVGDSKSCSDLGAEIHVAGRVDEIDQEGIAVVERNVHHIQGRELVVEGDCRGLDGDVTVLLILARLGEQLATRCGLGNDARLADERVAER